METDMQLLLQESPVGFARISLAQDSAGKVAGIEVLDFNPAFARLAGPGFPETWREALAACAAGEGQGSVLFFVRETKTHCLVQTAPAGPGILAIWATDVTREQERLSELERTDQAYRNVIEGSDLGTWELNIQTGEETINERWAGMLGYTLEELAPVSIRTWQENMHPEDWVRIQPDIAQGYQMGYGHYSIEFRMRHKDGRWVWINGRGKVNSWTEDGQPLLTSGTHMDITAIKEAQEEMAYLSYHDQLTGLYNRRFYEEELRRVDIERNLPIALIMADVNGLKLTNDAFGHQEGDRLLLEIADVLRKSCRGDEIIARIGGDEFVILLPNTTAEEAQKMTGRIYQKTRSAPRGRRLLSMSLGFAVKTSPQENMQEVFRNAEDDMYRHKIAESNSMRSQSIDLIMNSLFEKSPREMLHSKRVGELCEKIATKLYFPKEEIRQIGIAGLVHDIGKIGVSNLILDKEGRLTEEEREEMMKHSEVGHRILSSVAEFSEIAQYVLFHQERWDGSGYPRALQGEEIPVESRIIAVADAYDAMTSDRSYRSRMSREAAVLEIERQAGRQFDPRIVRVFLDKIMNGSE